MPPDLWAAENRIYPAHAPVPGPRDPTLTPYAIAPMRALAAGEHKRVVSVFGAQMGKTDGFLDAIGERMDRAPVPMIYCGPSREFIATQFEPRIMELVEQAETLKRKFAFGKRNTKTRKLFSGVPLRLATAGSSKALKSDPAGIGLLDEVDELLANVSGAGNPVELLEARGYTYAEYVLAATSTPSLGAVDIELDEDSGLLFWKEAPPEDLESAIWRMWQAGTRHHWCWPCPSCGHYFVPRFRNLWWPKGATPAEARHEAVVRCPDEACGGFVDETVKADCNARGRYVAPGLTVTTAGEVEGEAPDNDTASFWASGLASPFVTIGARAEAFLKADLSGDPNSILTAVNAAFGELYAPGGGQAPEWKEVDALRMPGLARGDLPSDAKVLTLAVDVQLNRLVYVVRAWGGRSTSWLVDHGELYGDVDVDEEGRLGTMLLPVWNELADLLTSSFGGMAIRRAFVDSGFRPGKPYQVPINRVYEFCRRFPRLAYPTKGYASRPKPIIWSKPELTKRGEVSKRGLALAQLDTDHWKSWVHERVRWPSDEPGAWHLHEDVDTDYCRQIVSEARLLKATGRPIWVRRSRENHYLDCEAMAAACAWTLNVHRIPAPDAKPADAPALPPEDPNIPAAEGAEEVAPGPKRTGGRSSYALRGSRARKGRWLS